MSKSRGILGDIHRRRRCRLHNALIHGQRTSVIALCRLQSGGARLGVRPAVTSGIGAIVIGVEIPVALPHGTIVDSADAVDRFTAGFEHHREFNERGRSKPRSGRGSEPLTMVEARNPVAKYDPKTNANPWQNAGWFQRTWENSDVLFWTPCGPAPAGDVRRHTRWSTSWKGEVVVLRRPFRSCAAGFLPDRFCGCPRDHVKTGDGMTCCACRSRQCIELDSDETSR